MTYICVIIYEDPHLDICVSFKDLLAQFRLPLVAEPRRNVVFNLVVDHHHDDHGGDHTGQDDG